MPAKALQSRAFFAAVSQWVKRACTWHRKWKNPADRKIEKRIGCGMSCSVCSRCRPIPIAPHDFRKRILRYQNEWLTFLDHPGVAPTNNLAEQALRPWSYCGS